MSVDALVALITRVSLQNLLRSVPTFKDSFEELIFACKSLILIDDSFADHGQINLGVHKYDSDLNIVLSPHNKTIGTFLSDTLLASAYAYTTFFDVVTKNKTIYK